MCICFLVCLCVCCLVCVCVFFSGLFVCLFSCLFVCAFASCPALTWHACSSRSCCRTRAWLSRVTRLVRLPWPLPPTTCAAWRGSPHSSLLQRPLRPRPCPLRTRQHLLRPRPHPLRPTQLLTMKERLRLSPTLEPVPAPQLRPIPVLGIVLPAFCPM